MNEFDRSVIDTATSLAGAGFAVHWLHPRTKRPIGDGWSNADRPTIEGLKATHRSGNNIGVRLGQPSALACGGYLHVIDLDIRDEQQSDDATRALVALLRGIDIASLPLVKSGSGGKSRHIYFVTDKPFYSRKLALSEGKHRGPDGKWHYDWEVELFGTGKQVVLPPSIHPVTNQPYEWLREFDLDLLDMGLSPSIPSSLIEQIAEAQSETYEFENREPLTFKPGQLEADLDEIPISDLHYDDWLRVGQALHHQFGGSDEGWQLWLKYSRRSKKYDGDDRTMQRKWRSFGRNRRQPVTMATIRQWAIDARQERLLAEFDDLEDDFQDDSQPGKNGGNAGLEGDFLPSTGHPQIDIDDLLGEPVATPTAAPAASEEKKSELDWKSLLHINPDSGEIKSTLHNIGLIVRNDPRIAGVPQLNEFTKEIVQRRPVGLMPKRARAEKPVRQLDGTVWQVKDPVNGTLWSETHDSSLRSVLEAPRGQGGYGIKVTDRDLRSAIDTSASDNAFHPVREYLQSLTWDGKKRLERLFIDYVGAPDDAYNRSVARIALLAAVTRVFEPGHKFDYAIILEGLQGKRKSTFICALGKMWFSELDGDFHDQKQMVELMQGAWIMEIPELSGFGRADVRAIKAFISRSEDKVRLAYAKRAMEYPRQCIFIGSTNDREYLKDDTGGRRFWPVTCNVEEIDVERFEGEVDQFWAEAYTLYREMRAAKPHGRLPLYLDDNVAREIAGELQESRRVESTEDHMIEPIRAWLDTPIQVGDGFDENATELRSYTCTIEVAVEALGMTPKEYYKDRTLAFQIGRVLNRMPGWTKVGGTGRHHFEKWGQQRAFARIITPKG